MILSTLPVLSGSSGALAQQKVSSIQNELDVHESKQFVVQVLCLQIEKRNVRTKKKKKDVIFLNPL